MSYSDQKYHSRPEQPMAFGTNVGTATATVSGGVITNTGVISLPKYFQATKVTKVRVIVNTIPAVAVTGTTLNFLNGTNTFATVAVGSSTAGQSLDATMTTTNGTFTASSGPTVNCVSTSTASNSGAATGVYSVYFEALEQLV
jgi:hypothetical protein